MDADSSYGDWFSISGGSVTSLSFTPPDAGLHYVHLNVQLQAVRAAGVYSNSAVASTKALAAPSGVSASLSGSSVSLSWDNPFDDSIDGKYQYKIKTIGAGSSWPTPWSEIDVSSQKTSKTFSTSITVTGDGNRNVQLRAKGDNNPATIVSTGRPAEPSISGLSPAGSSSGSGARVTWTAAASSPKGSVTVVWADPGDDSIVKYQYRLKPRPTGPSGGRYSQWIDIVGSGASTTTHTFVLPTPEKYRIMLRAVNNEVGYRAVFQVEPSWPAPAAPTGLEASLDEDEGSVSLSWDNPFNGFIQAYQYRIKTAGAGNSYSDWTDITSSIPDSSRFIAEGGNTEFTGVALSATINNVTGKERRIVQLRALHDVGDPSSSATASTGRPAEPSISGLSPAGSSSGSGARVTWTAAASSPKGSVTVVWADPGDDSIVKYQYRLKPRPTGPSGGRYSQWIDIVGSGASTTTHTFVLPTPEKYRIMLRAVNNEVGYRAVFQVEPSWPAPAAPTGLEASLDEDEGSVSLSWDNPFNGFIQAYQYRIKTAGAGNSYSDWTDITSSIPDSSRFIAEGGNTEFTGVALSATINNVTGKERRIVQLRALHDVGDPSSSATASTG